MPENATRLSATTTRELPAGDVLRARAPLPTTLGTAELRSRIGAEIRAQAVFSARVHNARVLDTIQEWTSKLAAGDTDRATARWRILEAIRETGYTPEGGFPDAPEGAVPPAVAGTLQDLTSLRRLNLIVDTLSALARGRAQQMRGMEPDRLRAAPAWELYRAEEKSMPRAWGGPHVGSPPMHGGQADPRSRWEIAGGKVYGNGRLIALKGDPVWGELGSSSNFDDALDVDFAPFAFHSGMGLMPVMFDKAKSLGVTGPDGESIEEWLAQEHAVLLDTQEAILPPPRQSVRDLGEPAKRMLERQGVEIVDQGRTATVPGAKERVLAEIAARREARAARQQQIMDEARRTMGLPTKGGAR